MTSEHKLQKYDSNGKLIKCIGAEGTKEGEFNSLRGITLHKNQVYVCDRNNDRLQVFDLDLNFVRTIGSLPTDKCEFKEPIDVKFDTGGNMYVTEIGNRRVQVRDASGHFVREFGQEGEQKLLGPSGLHIADDYVHVSDY